MNCCKVSKDPTLAAMEQKDWELVEPEGIHQVFVNKYFNKF